MPRKVKIILNPMANMGKAWRAADELRPIVAEYGHADWSGTVYPTHAVELARQAGEQGYDLVVAMGGDGTVHEVVNGLMQVPADKRPILGVVPVGSGNDFAHAIGVPVEPAHALAHALQGEPSRVDLGLMTDEHGRQEYFDNSLRIGFDAVVTIRSHKLPVVRGFLMYLTAVIQTILLNHKPAHMRLQADDQAWEQSALMLTVCNGPREGGGFIIAPEAKNDDGILHYAIVGKVSRATMFRLVPEFMKGTHARFPQVRLGACRRFTLSADQALYIHADGEIYTGFGSDLRQLRLEVLPAALEVIRG
ncbi:MAG: diacylglycerol kinase family lipid kinase [Anaerolineales bacterium]